MSELAEDEGTRSFAPCRVAVVVGLAVMLLGAGVASPAVAPAAAESGIHVSLDPTRSVVDSAETIQIDVTVRNDADAESPAPVVIIDTLPSGWTVESWSGSEAAYRKSTNEWLWTTIGSGETVQFTIEISVPADASGEGAIAVTLSDGDDRTATADTVITVTEGNSGAADGSASDGENGESPIQFDVPGFGFQVALVAILVVSLFARRRSKGS